MLKKKEEGKTVFVTDPYRVACHHAEPWKEEWAVGSQQLFQQEIAAIKCARERYLPSLQKWAGGVDLSPMLYGHFVEPFPPGQP